MNYDTLLVKLRADVRGLTIMLEGGRSMSMKPGKTYEITPKDWPLVSNHCVLSEPKWEIIHKPILKIWTTDGIGDIHWVMLKLGAIKKASGAEQIYLTVRDISPARPLRAKSYLSLCPLVDRVTYKKTNFSTPPWGFTANVDGYDYLIDATRPLERGMHIEDWMPEMKTDYMYPMESVAPMEPKNIAVLTMGDDDAVRNWHGNFGDKEWANLIEWLGRRMKVVVVGKWKDKAVVERVKEVSITKFVDLTEKTSFTQLMSLMLGARIVIGSISGTLIVAAGRLGAKVVSLWPGSNAAIKLPEAMRDSWIPHGINPNYRALGFDEPLENIKRVVSEVADLDDTLL